MPSNYRSRREENGAKRRDFNNSYNPAIRGPVAIMKLQRIVLNWRRDEDRRDHRSQRVRENTRIIIPDQRSRSWLVRLPPARIAGSRRARDIDLDEIQEDAHAYLTNIDSGGKGEEVSRRRFTVTERVFLSLSSYPRSSISFFQPGFFLVVATAFGKLTGSRTAYWIISGACRRRESGRSGRVPAEPRRIDLPRESVNESEAESERASERAILEIGTATRRAAPHRAEPRSRSRSRTRRVRVCVRVSSTMMLTTTRRRTANY